MVKEAPSVGRILTMVAFALSCVGLLLWLWMSFGGPMPLRPQGYRVKTHIPETALLTKAADIRMAGLDIGNITSLKLNRDGGQEVEMEIDPEFAPLPADTRLVVRQKSLLGQLYLELTPGNRDGPKLDDGDTIPSKSVVESVEFDEIISTFNRETRRNFQGWIREIADAIDNGRGEDLSNAIGNLDDFAAAGSDTLKILDDQEPALRRLVKNTGITLNALTERRGQLRELIGNANTFFEALASRNDALAETIFVFPTFLSESRLTLDRLKKFAEDTDPLIRDLIPVAFQLRPALHDLGALAPDLKNVFRKLDPVITESSRTLPAAQRFLKGAKPLFPALHTYLPEFNPFVSFLNYQQEALAGFLVGGAASLNGVLPPLNENEGPRHYLRQYSITNARTLAVGTSRPTYERGNAYPLPNYLKRFRPLGMTETFDCKNTNATPTPQNPSTRVNDRGEVRDAVNGEPPCIVQPPQLWGNTMFPRLERGNLIVTKPVDNAGTREPRLP
jgi:phospholipid/cholesterol/gamma-HCH transport system substrate-binding protein